jgi:hypothetical protein
MARAAYTGISVHHIWVLQVTTGIRSMGGTQSTPKITAQDRAILEYALHPILYTSFS